MSLPLLDGMLNDNGTALAQGADLPLRFGVFHWGNGIFHADWRPSQTGTNWELPPNFRSFGSLQSYMTQFIDYDHVDSSPGHIPARGIALSSSHDLNTGVSGVGTYRGQNHPEPSLDALVVEHWSGLTQFDSIEVGINQAGPYKGNSSWKRGGMTYNRHEPDPAKVFERLFSGVTALPTGTGGADDGIREVTAAFGNSMLDAVAADTDSLKARLGATDRARLDQHLEGVRALEKRFELVDTPVTCDSPEISADRFTGNMLERAEVMGDVLATALACDQTRVFSFEWSANQSQANYGDDLGINGQHHEDISHNLSGRGSDHSTIITYAMDGLAYLAEALRNTPEADGNVLDNSLIFATSEHANPNSHNYIDHPLLFLGKAGGRINSGRVIAGGGGQQAPRVLLTAAHAVEPAIERLGQADSGGVNREATETVAEAEA